MPDFEAMLRLTVNPFELIVRGTLMYWFLFLLFRFVLRRDVGSLGLADVLLLVVVADASQNAMAGGYESVTDGCILVATIGAWNWLFDWASYRFDAAHRFLERPPLPLVLNGRVLRENLRREMISLADLHAKLREQGVDNVAQVKLAVMESEGGISVIRKDGGSPAPPPPPGPP